MKVNIIVADEFYNNAENVRSFALTQEFNISGNYPGYRTKSHLTSDTKIAIQNLLYPHAGLITNWHDQDGFTGSFQLTYASDRSWIHADIYNAWAGVLYLTPDAPLSGGTGIYRYKENKAYTEKELQGEYESQDFTKWELVDQIGNKFNRLVLYRADLFHTSMNYFGKDPLSGRLFQLFFIDTEN